MSEQRQKPEAKSAAANSESRAKRARISDVEHLGGCRMVASVRHFPPFQVDEPDIAGGTDTGPSPLEFVTSGLAACQVVSIAKIAEAMKFSFVQLSAHVEADVIFRKSKFSDEFVPRFSEARIRVEIATKESSERLAELQNRTEERCPASNLFIDAQVPISVTWELRK